MGGSVVTPPPVVQPFPAGVDGDPNTRHVMAYVPGSKEVLDVQDPPRTGWRMAASVTLRIERVRPDFGLVNPCGSTGAGELCRDVSRGDGVCLELRAISLAERLGRDGSDNQRDVEAPTGTAIAVAGCGYPCQTSAIAAAPRGSVPSTCC